jgi:2-polyprenyl-3-methyl-5-hydroxy-6-metoxy-1,4-benzoquinol methylase
MDPDRSGRHDTTDLHAKDGDVMKDFHPCTFAPSPAQAKLTAKFLAAMFPSDATVVDVGFGEGAFLREAQARGLHPIGVDRDARFVSSAHEAGYKAFQATATELDTVVEGPVDGIVAQQLIEHLSPTEAQHFLLGAANLVRPHGLLVIVTPNFRDWRVASELFWVDPTHVRPYNEGSLRALTAAASWVLEASGDEPLRTTRRSLLDRVGRLRHGRDYGKCSNWYRFRRLPS